DEVQVVEYLGGLGIPGVARGHLRRVGDVGREPIARILASALREEADPREGSGEIEGCRGLGRLERRVDFRLEIPLGESRRGHGRKERNCKYLHAPSLSPAAPIPSRYISHTWRFLSHAATTASSMCSCFANRSTARHPAFEWVMSAFSCSSKNSSSRSDSPKSSPQRSRSRPNQPCFFIVPVP